MSPPSTIRSLLLVLLVCLVVAPVGALHSATDQRVAQVGHTPGAVADETDTGVVQVNNASNYLEPQAVGESRQSIDRSEVDVAAGVGVSTAKLHGRHDRLAFDHSLEEVRRADQQIDSIKAEFRQLEADIGALERFHRASLSAYTNGSISTDTLHRRLAHIDAAAGQKYRHLDSLRSAINQVGAPRDLHARAQTIRGTLIGLSGPGTGRLSEALAGRGQATNFYVAAFGDHGLVVSTITDGWVYRQAFDGSETVSGGVDQFQVESDKGVTAAYRRAVEVYPWTDNNSFPAPRGGFGNLPIYQVRFQYPQGNLTTYLDGRTTNVFYEVQHRQLGAVPVAEPVRNENGTLAIAANATGGSWPMWLSLSRTDTGNAADAAVRIDGTYVGQTGPDGQLVTVQPNEPFTVNATTDNGESVEVTVGS